jgi:hypothetical protein
MDFLDTLSAELPPRRDDEPAGLRQDILDELSDHLSCAYTRELLRGARPSAARETVLGKFGDPAAVARRLWLDAMGGKIMAQRILIVACIVVAISSVCFAGIVWVRMTEQLRRSMADLRELEHARNVSLARAESRATNEELLKRIEALTKAVQSPQTPDWIPVSFKLTRGDLDGPPAAGCNANLGRATGGKFRGAKSGMGAQGGIEWTDSIHRVSDGNGLVDFGVVHPGDWEYTITCGAQSARAEWITSGNLNVLPGTKVSRSIICPADEPQPAPVRIRVEWPDDLARRRFLIHAWLACDGISYQQGLEWRISFDPRFRNVLFGMRGSAMKYTELQPQGWGAGLHLWRFAKPIKEKLEGFGAEASDPTHVFADATWGSDSALDADTLELTPGRYRLRQVLVLRSRHAGPANPKAERFDVLGHARPSDWFPLIIEARESPPSGEGEQQPFNQGANRARRAPGGSDPSKGLKRMTLPSSFWSGASAQFEVHSGRTNEWVIHLPDEVAAHLRNEPPGPE